MTDSYYETRKRLWNWGAYCRINPDRPDDSCANPLYEMMVNRESDDGYATDEDLAIVNRVRPAAPEPRPIDEADAESLDKLIHRIPERHRQTLTNKYVLRSLKPMPDEVDAAIRAIWDVQDADLSRMARGLR